MDGCRYESNCPLVGPGTIVGQSRETSCWPPILSEIWRMEIGLLQEWVCLGGVVDFKTTFPHMGPGTTGGVPSVRGLPKES